MQVYAASIMFGYFVRRVDKRFQLERSLGMLPQNQEEAVARLERLFSQVGCLAGPSSGCLTSLPPCNRQLLLVSGALERSVLP